MSLRRDTTQSFVCGLKALMLRHEDFLPPSESSSWAVANANCIMSDGKNDDMLLVVSRFHRLDTLEWIREYPQNSEKNFENCDFLVLSNCVKHFLLHAMDL